MVKALPELKELRNLLMLIHWKSENGSDKERVSVCTVNSTWNYIFNSINYLKRRDPDIEGSRNVHTRSYFCCEILKIC